MNTMGYGKRRYKRNTVLLIWNAVKSDLMTSDHLLVLRWQLLEEKVLNGCCEAGRRHGGKCIRFSVLHSAGQSYAHRGFQYCQGADRYWSDYSSTGTAAGRITQTVVA